jgi:ADP-ribosyl-[dinitrogen reductase] hydrolase
MHLPLESRIRAALLAHACGDALGAPAEFLDRDRVWIDMGVIRNLDGGAGWEPGEWTDDTAMAVEVAEGILEAPGDPVPAVGARWLRWAPTSKDLGGTIRAVFHEYKAMGARASWPAAAQRAPQVAAGRSAGTGSLMRSLPIALAFRDRTTMLTMSARISAMTHWDPLPEACCAVFCLWVSMLLDGADRTAAWHEAVADARRRFAAWPAVAGTPGPSPLPDGFWDRLTAIPRLYEGHLVATWQGYVVDCLECVVWHALKAASLEALLIAIANRGMESDTIGAIAGGAAGAYWGEDAIPQRWLTRLRDRERLSTLADRLADFRIK